MVQWLGAERLIGQAGKQVAPTPALVLSGGGARAAYQVGVLKAIADILPRGVANPFPIICGTSAGAINATAIATHATRFRAGVRGLDAVWRDFHAEQVYRTEFSTLTVNALRWFATLFVAGLGTRRPVSLLNNRPLRELLDRIIRFERIEQAIDSGHLHALAITASGYSSGESVSFFQADADTKPWRRARRVGVPATLGIDHLLASSAIPAIFPAVRIHREYFGDGAVRQLAPISPALHLGANRVLVVGVGEKNERPPRQSKARIRSPSLADIAGHVLDAAFLDSLEVDLERLERINRTISLIPEKTRRRENLPLKNIDVLTISPSQSLTAIAARHARDMPLSMRFFLRGSGANDSTGAVMLSYLLFEQGYCRDLINLGYGDALRRETEIARFFGYDRRLIHGAAANPPQDVW